MTGQSPAGRSFRQGAARVLAASSAAAALAAGLTGLGRGDAGHDDLGLADPQRLRASHPRQYARLHTKDGYERAVDLYKQGLAIDANYAPAWTVLAYCYRREANNSIRPLKEGYGLARDALNHALKVDPAYAPAFAELSRIALDYDVNPAAAARYLERAIAIEPTSEVLGYSSVRKRR